MNDVKTTKSDKIYSWVTTIFVVLILLISIAVNHVVI
jgi:hypothetical protein